MAAHRMRLCLAVLAVLACTAAAADVLVLTGSTFSDAVKKHDKLVVEFYAPWCGHCKKLDPEYEKAAGELKADGITLAKVDATEEGNKELASKFGVQGFPTLKVFRGDEATPEEYQGPREADGIVAHTRKLFGPVTAELSTADEVAKVVKEEVAVVGVFPGGESSAAFVAFKAAAESLRDDATFRHVTDAALVSDAAGKEGVFVYKTYDEPMTKFDGKKMDKEALVEFITKATTPRLTSLDRSNRNKKALQAMFADQKPKVLGVLGTDSSELKAFQDALVAIKEAHTDLHVLYVDPKENEGALNFFGVAASDAPCILVHEPTGNKKFSSGKLAVKKVASFVKDYVGGKIEPTIKSEPIPDKNDDPVTKLVAKNFDDVVFSGKDVLVEFYAPWCGHCKTLAPVYKELGEAYKDNADIVIAQIDATANDVTNPKFDVKGFPTLVFVNKAGDVISYDGGRKLEDLKAFVDKQTGAAASSDADTDAPASADDDDSKDEL